MSLLDTASASIDIYTQDGTITAVRVDEGVVDQELTSAVFSASMKIDYDWFTEQSALGTTINVGNTVNIYVTRGTDPYRKIFGGRIWDHSKEISGHVPRYLNFEARGWGDYLQGRWVGYTRTIDTIDNVFRWLIQPAIDANEITIGTIHSSYTTVTLDLLQSEVSVHDAISKLAEQNDWETFVDVDAQFNAFPRGSIEISETFENMILDTLWKESADKLINAQRVVGSRGRSIGSDSDYTESAVGWTSDAAVTRYSSTIGGSQPDIPDPSKGEGSYAIRFIKDDASGGAWARKTFSPGAINLSMHGALNFSISWEIRNSIAALATDDFLTLEIRYETDSSNYFTYLIRVSGSRAWSFGGSATKIWKYGWQEVSIPFNLMEKLTFMEGTPRWDNIASIKIIVLGPLPSGSYTVGTLMIDNMFFDQGFYYGYRTDSTSVDEFGERRGKLIYDPKFTSVSECTDLADAIITNYANPVQQFESIRTKELPSTNIQVGSQATITVAEITNSSIIRNIRYSIKEFDMDIDYSLSSTYIPTLDRLIADIAKYVDDADAAKLPSDLAPGAVLSFIRGPLGSNDLDIAHPTGELIRNPTFEIDSNSNGIPDNWYPANDQVNLRSSDEVRDGQFSMKIAYPNTVTSEYFPVVNQLSYFTEFWHKGEHDTGYGTLSAYIDFFGAAPNYASTGSRTIMESETSTAWTKRDLYIAKANVPSGSMWGKLRFQSDGGEHSYVDDVVMRQLIGSDGGVRDYMMPMEYSTSATSPELIFSRTFDVYNAWNKFVFTKAAMELRNDSDDSQKYASGRMVVSYNGVPKATFQSSHGENTYQRIEANSTIDPEKWKQSLVIDYYLWQNDGTDVAYMRYPEAWYTVQSMNLYIGHYWGED